MKKKVISIGLGLFTGLLFGFILMGGFGQNDNIKDVNNIEQIKKGDRNNMKKPMSGDFSQIEGSREKPEVLTGVISSGSIIE